MQNNFKVNFNNSFIIIINTFFKITNKQIYYISSVKNINIKCKDIKNEIQISLLLYFYISIFILVFFFDSIYIVYIYYVNHDNYCNYIIFKYKISYN